MGPQNVSVSQLTGALCTLTSLKNLHRYLEPGACLVPSD